MPLTMSRFAAQGRRSRRCGCTTGMGCTWRAGHNGGGTRAWPRAPQPTARRAAPRAALRPNWRTWTLASTRRLQPRAVSRGASNDAARVCADYLEQLARW